MFGRSFSEYDTPQMAFWHMNHALFGMHGDGKIIHLAPKMDMGISAKRPLNLNFCFKWLPGSRYKRTAVVVPQLFTYYIYLLYKVILGLWISRVEPTRLWALYFYKMDFVHCLYD